ncbi:unnamed protein product [Pylaiella littoralis]
MVIQYAFSWCTTYTPAGQTTDEEECAGYEAMWAVGLAIVMGVLFCCCFCGARKEEGTTAEQTPILATEASAPPTAQAYAVEATAPFKETTFASYADNGT